MQETRNPLVTAIIPTLNRKEDLRETLTRLAEQSYHDYEVVVADNGSTDGTAEMLEREFPAVRLIRLHYNFGNIVCRNLLVRNARGDYILCLDDDSFPGRDCISRMVSEFRKDPELALISCGVLDYGQYWAARGWHSLAEEEAPRRGDSGQETLHWIGCGGAFRRDLFEQVGYWDEWGMEVMWERTLLVKFLDAGFRIRRFSDIYVYHHWSRRGDPASFRLSPEAAVSGCKSVAMYFYKYYPADLLLLNLWRLVLKICYSAIEQRRGQYLVALFSTLGAAPAILRQRQRIRREVLKQVRVPLNFRGK